MTTRDAARLSTGDEVRWNDPDGGTCSRYILIDHVAVHGDTVCITDVDGIYLECFAHELE